MARKSNIEKDLQAMITRGGMPDSMRIASALATIPAAIEKRRENREVQASRDLTTISGFEARIGNKVNNYMASGDIYDESKITVLKDSINSLYDKHSSQFPELIAEFSDERDSALGIINNYSTKNKQKDLLLSKIEPTKDRLYNIAKTLGETTTADLSPDDRVKFRQEVRSAMEDVVTLDKLIEDPYYSRLSGWADVAEDVKYGISDASKQLLTQINTWQKATEGDPSSMYVINDAELQGLESAIFKNDASGIRAINEQIGADKTARMKSYETDYKTSLKEYETINSFFASNAFQRTLDAKNKAYDEADEEGKKRMDLDPEYWRVHNIDVPGLPDEGVDITQDVHIPLLRAKARATKIDVDYRNEHITGSSIAEILNKPLPWAKKRTSLEQKQKDHKKRVSDLGLTVPSVGGGEPVVTEGGDPLTVSELHKPFTPEEPTMPTGEKGQSIEGRLSDENKEYAKKYNTSVDHIGLLRGFYDKDDTATMDFPSYLNREANAGEFKKLSTKGAPPSPTVGEPLYKTYTNKRELRYGEPVVPNTSKSFKAAQSNLSSIVSDRFSNLSISEKGKYKGNKKESIRGFAKDKFEQWLKESGNLRKANWKTKGKYTVEDFKYFISTKTDKSGKVSKNPDVNVYTLYYPGAFKKGFPGGIFQTPDNSNDAYVEFAKDFDDFRKFLQES